MKSCALIPFLLGCFSLAASAPAATPSKPNVILIYSDDHGYADLAAQKTDPDIRTLNDQGKIWYDELSRMIGSDNKGKIEILAKKGGKTGLREFGIHARSGGESAGDWRGKGPESGGYPAQVPPAPRPSGEAEERVRGQGKDKGKGAWKARSTGYASKAPSWDEATQWSPPAASSSSSWQWSDSWWY